MRVAYRAPFGHPTGYARAAADYAIALAKAGCEVWPWPLDDVRTPGWLPPGLGAELAALPTFDNSERPDVVVMHEPLGRAIKESVGHGVTEPRALVTTWETDRVPAEYEGRARRFYAICVPSTATAAAFAGPVTVIPHCFDPAEITPLPPPTSERYTFYAIGAWEPRKNLLGVLTAYLSEFTADDPVRLRVLTDSTIDADWLTLYVRHAMGLDGLEDSLADLTITRGPVDYEQVAALHAEGDCYVSASRGESWDLACFEAVARGRPTITPDGLGAAEYLERLAGWHPRYRSQPTPAVVALWTREDEGRAVVSRVAPRGVTARQRWGEPALNSLGTIMRETARDRVGRTAEAGEHLPGDVIADRETVRVYSHETVGAQMRRWLEEIIVGD